MATAAVDNGVNVQALLDAREALQGSPEATQFTWRSSCKWVKGTHSQGTVKGFFGLGEEQSHKTETSFEADHPRSSRRRTTASRRSSTSSSGWRAASRRASRRSRRTGDPAALGRIAARRQDGHPRDSRHGYRRAQRLRDVKVTFNIDADASKQDIEAIVAQSQKRSAVYDAITNPVNVTVEVV